MNEVMKKETKKPHLFMVRFLLFPTIALCGYPLMMMNVLGDHFLAHAAWVSLLTYSWYCVGGSLHEAVHHTLFSSKWKNVWYGRLLGWMIGIPYSVYRESHRRHHAYMNTPQDYELWPYSDPNASLSFRRLFVWLDLLLGVFTAPLIYSRIYLKNDLRLSAEVKRQITFEYLGLIPFWGAVCAGLYMFLKPELGQPWRLEAFWLLPLILSPTINTARKFVEHLGMESTDPVLGTRTVVCSNWIESWPSFFNFDIAVHGPHHRYPKAQHYELTDKLTEYQQSHPDVEVPVFRSYVSAFADVAWCLWANPKTGTHAVDDEQKNHRAEKSTQVQGFDCRKAA